MIKEIVLHGDSWDYDLITRGIELSKDTEGICAEIGLRLGGGSKHIIDGIAEFCPNKVAIAIDPYGSILYEHKEKQFIRLDYTEDMKSDCLSNLYQYVKEKKVHFIFFNLEDIEFFNRYADGIPVYSIDKTVQNKYSFVHFDGPHAVDPILEEINFFLPRISKGTCFVFDDISKTDYYYNHDLVEKYLFDNGFKLIEKRDRKGLYQYEN